jgi:hypothetical protein
MNLVSVRRRCVVPSLVLALALSAQAQPVVGEPASALVFPALQNGNGRLTLITVTNTLRDFQSCGNGFRAGDVAVHLRFFDMHNGACVVFDRTHLLTPSDTLTVNFVNENPATEGEGWVWVEAQDPENLRAIDYDFLVGSAIIADTRTGIRMRYEPYGFRANPPATASTDGCGRRLTDVDHDNRADFDGVEYDYWPARLILDEFIQENGSVTSELFVASADGSLSDGSQTMLDFLAFSNNERAYSFSATFDCYFHRSLRSLSLITSSLMGDPNELRIGGHASSLQTGWLNFGGSDGVLGVFLQRIGTGCVAEGQVLQYSGQYGSPSDPGHVPVSLAR